jgi:hypothetical protein
MQHNNNRYYTIYNFYHYNTYYCHAITSVATGTGTGTRLQLASVQQRQARDAAHQLQLRIEALGDAHVREPYLPDKVQLLGLGHVH